MDELDALLGGLKPKTDDPLDGLLASMKASTVPDLPNLPAPKVDMQPQGRWLERGLGAAANAYKNPPMAAAGPAALPVDANKPREWKPDPNYFDTPIINIPEPDQAAPDAGIVEKTLRGAGRSAARNVSALTTPRNVGIGTGLGLANFAAAAFPPLIPVAQAANATAGTYFGMEMLKQVPEQTRQFSEAVEKGDVEGAAGAMTDTALTAAMVAGIAGHGGKLIAEAAKAKAGLPEPIRTDINVTPPSYGKDHIPGQPVDMGVRDLSTSEAGATMPGGQASAEFIQSTVLGDSAAKPRPSRRKAKPTMEEKPFDAMAEIPYILDQRVDMGTPPIPKRPKVGPDPLEALPQLPGQPVDMGVRPLAKLDRAKKPFDASAAVEPPKPPDLGRGIRFDDITTETARREPVPPSQQPVKRTPGEPLIPPEDLSEQPRFTLGDVMRETEKKQAKADAKAATKQQPDLPPLPLLDAMPPQEAVSATPPPTVAAAPRPVPPKPALKPPAPVNPRRANQAGVLRIPGSQPSAPAPAAPPVTPQVQNALNHFAREQARQDAAKQRPAASLRDKAKQAKDWTVSKFEDSMAPLTRDMKRVGAAIPGAKHLPAWKAMDNLIDKSLRSRVIASLEVERAGIKYIADNAENVSALGQYLIARHGRTLGKMGVEMGRDVAADSQSVAALRNEIAVPERGKPGDYNYRAPMTYEQVGRAVTDFNNGLLDQYARSGLITPEFAAELKARYPYYAPFNRILEHLNDPEIAGLGPINNRAVASIAAQHLVKKIKGSEAVIENPFEMTMARAEQAYADITKNDAARFFTTMAENTPELNGLVRRIPHTKAESIPDARKISVFENGIKVDFETAPEIAAAAKTLNVPQLGAAIKIAAAFSRLKKVGTTGMNFGFFAVNIVRDPFDIYINADRGVGVRAAADPRIAATAAKAATHDWPALERATQGKLGGKSAEWDELVRGGGGFTEFDLSRQQIAEAIERNRTDRPTTPQQKVKNTVYRASQAWRTLENHFSRSEQLSRMRLYEAAKAKALKDGASPAEARQMATWESNNVLPNYLRSGSFVKAFAPALPYFNAKIQGAKVMRRSLMDRPVETSAKIATAVIMPTVASVVWNMSDPERRKIYMDIPDDEKNRALIWAYGDATKDSRGRYENVFKMPMSAGAAYLGAPIRKAVEALFIEDENKGLAFAKEFLGTVPDAAVGTFTPLDPKESIAKTALAPILSFQAAAPTTQVVTNYDLYRDAPIESTEMQQLPVGERAYDWTSGTAKELARGVLPKLGIETSPAKVDAWLYYTFGGAVQYAVAASDAALKAAGAIPEAAARGGRTPVSEVEARFKGARGGKLRSDQYKLRRDVKDVWSTKFIREMESQPGYAEWDRDTKREMKNKMARKAGEIVQQLTDRPDYEGSDDAAKVRALKSLLESSKQATK